MGRYFGWQTPLVATVPGRLVILCRSVYDIAGECWGPMTEYQKMPRVSAERFVSDSGPLVRYAIREITN
jgi:hypothetical protein